MKPIKLTIKGLNSFIEKQSIDFNKLTSRGLFGIFGPTGSGKSTILDGMTLALYGEVARKSSNFINTNCDTVSVSYEFQIREKDVKHYIVEREFKRNKDGGINNKLAKIMEIIDGEPCIIEEKATKVNKKCVEILGLSCEDFTRTVVLPQGKFSDFLKLEGKQRRDMLERLFALHKYGDQLSSKLSNVVRAEKSERDILQGKLSGYEDISEEIFNEKKIQYENKRIEEKQQLESLEHIKKNFDKSKVIWELQNELKECHEKKKKLLEEQDEINKKKAIQERAEAALRVKPNIDSFSSINNNINKQEEKLTNTKIKLEKLNKDKKDIEIKFNNISKEKEEKYPKLIVIQDRLIDGLKEEEQIKVLDDETENLRGKWVRLNKDKEGLTNKVQICDKKINDANNKVKDCENELNSIKIDENYKEQVIKGLNLEERIRQNLSKEQFLKLHISEKLNEVKDKQDKLDEMKSKYVEVENTLTTTEKGLEDVLKNNPGSEDELLKSSDEVKKLEGIYNNLKEFKEERIIPLRENEKLSLENDKNEKNLSVLKREIESLSEIITKVEKENLAQILRKSLMVGEPCPVCGTIHNNHREIKNISEEIDGDHIDKMKKELSIKQDSQKKLEICIENTRSKIEFNKTNIDKLSGKIDSLEKESGNRDIEIIRNQFENLRVSIERYKKKKQELEDNCKRLQESKGKLEVEIGKYNTFIQENTKLLENKNDELKELQKDTTKNEAEVNQLKITLNLETNSESLRNKYEDIKLLEDKIKKINANIIDGRNISESQQAVCKKLQDKVNSLVEDMARIKTMGSEKAKILKEKKDKIKLLMDGRESLSVYKAEIDREIKRIDEEFRSVEELKKNVEDEIQKYNTEKISLDSAIKELTELKNDIEHKLQLQLQKEKFQSKDEVMKALMTEEQVEVLKTYINSYEEKLKKISLNIENLIVKMDGNNISEEQWTSINEELKQAEQYLEQLKKEVTTLSKELTDIEKKLKLFKDLLADKEKIEHKLSILNDLETLFKGKKFVEFVASHQLRYISIEASKRLQEITNGDYGLELDKDSSKFIIRDYKNGGATRDASTLSGGEVFLASLSLALALSSQIQLKGTAPLELFFLDEGFGTLDTNLLDTVMQSLEKIHNSKLSVGIISHVDEIKNRVPVKLMVEPAVSGLGGSKVKIENS